jgi:hypothetical protein
MGEDHVGSSRLCLFIGIPAHIDLHGVAGLLLKVVDEFGKKAALKYRSHGG